MNRRDLDPRVLDAMAKPLRRALEQPARERAARAEARAAQLEAEVAELSSLAEEGALLALEAASDEVVAQQRAGRREAHWRRVAVELWHAAGRPAPAAICPPCSSTSPSPSRSASSTASPSPSASAVSGASLDATGSTSPTPSTGISPSARERALVLRLRRNAASSPPSSAELDRAEALVRSATGEH